MKRKLVSRLRRLRLDADLTLQDASSRSGISISRLSLLERGLAEASYANCVGLAKAYRLPFVAVRAAADATAATFMTKGG